MFRSLMILAALALVMGAGFLVRGTNAANATATAATTAPIGCDCDLCVCDVCEPGVCGCDGCDCGECTCEVCDCDVCDCATCDCGACDVVDASATTLTSTSAGDAAPTCCSVSGTCCQE